MQIERKELPTKPCTMKELSFQYEVSSKTLRTWLKRHQTVIGERTGHYFTALQVKQIYECLGEPPVKE